MRHDSPQNEAGLPRGGRVLLDTQVVNDANEVDFVLPAAPYNRFQIEIDNWASVQNDVSARMKFTIGGVLRELANDYQWTNISYTSNANAESREDSTASAMFLVGTNNHYRFGDGANESWSQDITIDPGLDSEHLPRIWNTGTGYTDTPTVCHMTGGGMYIGTDSGAFGRVEGVRIEMDANLIRRGTFRLYGTE